MIDPTHDLDPIVAVAKYDAAGTIVMVGDRALSIVMAQIAAGEPIVLSEIGHLEAAAHRIDLSTLTIVAKDPA